MKECYWETLLKKKCRPKCHRKSEKGRHIHVHNVEMANTRLIFCCEHGYFLQVFRAFIFLRFTIITSLFLHFFTRVPHFNSFTGDEKYKSHLLYLCSEAREAKLPPWEHINITGNFIKNAVVPSVTKKRFIVLDILCQNWSQRCWLLGRYVWPAVLEGAYKHLNNFVRTT